MNWLLFIRTAYRLWIPTSRDRRYKAALTTLLCLYRYPQLDTATKAKIDDEIVLIFKQFGLYPYWRFIRNIPEKTRAGDRAIAMCRLDIPTGIEGLHWSDFMHPWHQDAAAQLIMDFKSYSAETDQAIEFLRTHGVHSEQIDHYSRDWLHKAQVQSHDV